MAAAARCFSVCARSAQKAMPPRPRPPPESEIEEAFVKGTGPGGQKINKTNSAVQLRHLPTGIVVKSQATRSRSQNRTIARNLLAARLDELRNGAESRTAVVSAAKQKRYASATKKARRKYRKLDEEKRGAAEAAGATGAAGAVGTLLKADEQAWENEEQDEEEEGEEEGEEEEEEVEGEEVWGNEEVAEEKNGHTQNTEPPKRPT